MRRRPRGKTPGLVYADEDKRGVTFGFVDSVTHTGDLLFCSLLKWQAAGEMAWLMERMGDAAGRHKYSGSGRAAQGGYLCDFRRSLAAICARPPARARNGTCGAPRTRCISACWTRTSKRRACEALARGYNGGKIAWRGNIRHVPTDGDFSEDTAWESALAKKNTYQNGAYWGTPTGWVAYAIAKVERRGGATARARVY